MKKQSMEVMFFLSLLISSLTAQADTKPLTAYLPTAIYLPQNFDSNDTAQIVLEGFMPDNCHKVAPTLVRAVPDKNKIIIRFQVNILTDKICTEMVSPFQKAIDLGVLPSGKYDIFFEDKEGTFRKMEEQFTIKPAKNNAHPDDYLYAYVSEATVSTQQGDEPPTLYLRGNLTNSCMKLKEVRFAFTKENVLEVLPIAEMTAGKDCRRALTPFKSSVVLNRGFIGPTLVHVRSVNGQSINHVYRFQ